MTQSNAMLPKKVKVGAMKYTVSIVDNMFAEHELFGRVTYGDQRIKIAGDISPQRQVNTFIHELTHAIIFEAGQWESTDDEEFVRKFSNMMTQVMQDNGWLTKGVLRK